jgi:DNA replication protein DnaC
MADSQCPHCLGSGWVVIEKHGLSAAKRCSCEQPALDARREASAQIPPLYQNAAFDNFSTAHENPQSEIALKQVMQIVRAYVRDFPLVSPPGLLLVGGTGLGKTHLAVAALRRLLERGFQAVFFNYQELLQRIHAGYDRLADRQDREAYQLALDAPILLIDDLGSNRAHQWIEDTMTSIITYRCDNKLPLIATTNMTDPQIGYSAPDADRRSPSGLDYKYTLTDRIGQRARSRLFEMCKVVKMPEAGDYRVRRSQRP